MQGFITANFITLTTTEDLKTAMLRQKISVLDHFRDKIDLPKKLHARIDNFCHFAAINNVSLEE
jgi:hypothetical protein